MTLTATNLGNGPFEGFVPEVLTTHFELRETPDAHPLYVVVSNLPEDDGFEAETCVFAAHPDGSLDIRWYADNGTILDLPGDIPAHEVITLMGFELIPAAV